MNKTNKAFTFVEIMVVVALIALISAIAMVNLLASRRAVEYNLCINNRAVLEHAEISYNAHTKSHSTSFDDLVTSGYLSKALICPSQGVYAWVPYDIKDPKYQTEIGCSFHAPAATEQEVPQVETPAEKKARLKAEKAAAQAAAKAAKAAEAAAKAAKKKKK
ncbi:MAG: type II secretion system protein [Candidatus Omnitrophota bacterium]